MMNVLEKKFHIDSREKVFDGNHRRKMIHALRQSEIAFQEGKVQFRELAQAREWAKRIKDEAISNLDKYLLEFEENFTRNGGKVIWAKNGDEALEAIWNICQDKNARRVVKSKSMVSEELQLNSYLLARNIEVMETDLGEYIQDLSGEPPYHIVAPAIHKSKEEVSKLFHDKLGVPDFLSPEDLTKVARSVLRKGFEEADIGVTGANFLLSDIGGVAITENEGNGRLATAFPNTHIVITGIEKILPSVKDLSLFWPLLATHGSGQKITVYNSIFTGPKRQNESDGPEDMYVILLDNGRSTLLSDPDMKESLNCIRCGACLNVCPVYKNIGGHTYNSVYSGPIGSVITPHLSGMKNYNHLSHASTLCGACTEVCPVKINLHGLLLRNRKESVDLRYKSKKERFSWYVWKKTMLSRGKMNLVNGQIKQFTFKILFKKSWSDYREVPIFPQKSFNQQWREKSSESN